MSMGVKRSAAEEGMVSFDRALLGRRAKLRLPLALPTGCNTSSYHRRFIHTPGPRHSLPCAPPHGIHHLPRKKRPDVLNRDRIPARDGFDAVEGLSLIHI